MWTRLLNSKTLKLLQGQIGATVEDDSTETRQKSTRHQSILDGQDIPTFKTNTNNRLRSLTRMHFTQI